MSDKPQALIVEDDRDLSLIFRTAMEKAGAEVTQWRMVKKPLI